MTNETESRRLAREVAHRLLGQMGPPELHLREIGDRRDHGPTHISCECDAAKADDFDDSSEAP